MGKLTIAFLLFGCILLASAAAGPDRHEDGPGHEISIDARRAHGRPHGRPRPPHHRPRPGSDSDSEESNEKPRPRPPRPSRPTTSESPSEVPEDEGSGSEGHESE